jgi:predicted transcriptional regulator
VPPKPYLLETAGVALYGSTWQTAIARDLGVADRTVRRWLKERRSIDAVTLATLLDIARRRQEEISRAVTMIQDAERCACDPR